MHPEEWFHQGQPDEPSPEDKIRWAAVQREQGGMFWQPPAPQAEATPIDGPRPGGVKAAVAAAAAAAQAKTVKPRPKDRGDER